MLQALEQYFPTETSWTVPNGGLFLWVHLPDKLPIQAICNEAVSQKVLIASGSSFFPGQQGYPAMRLYFSHTLEDIDRGISVVGTLLKGHLLALRHSC
jgi:DNA-binding transcriptional MocR family regulator